MPHMVRCWCPCDVDIHTVGVLGVVPQDRGYLANTAWPVGFAVVSCSTWSFSASQPPRRMLPVSQPSSVSSVLWWCQADAMFHLDNLVGPTHLQWMSAGD